jgi:hypothetical protein
MENNKRRKPKESTITDQSFSKLMIRKKRKEKTGWKNARFST